MEPFFNDHTSYGALMAMFYPILFFLMNKKVSSTNTRIFLIVLIAIFSLGLILSYTRAAWVSLLAALIVYFLYKFKIKLGVILTLSAVVILTIVFSWSKIMMKLEKNNQDSSDELAEHVKSISNISTDASNLERINRWKSALRMFKERPVFGFGPGTYSFVYAPYQLSSEKTIISTNAGDMGNAHSEYIGPLSESGALGLLTFLLIVLTIYWQASKLYHSLDESTLKSLVLAIIVGFTTYAVHGLLNNYLDTDKASVPFWGFAAMLVAIEVYKDELTFDTKS
jgi:O-antigen ligase